jgi:hypothetical protein
MKTLAEQTITVDGARFELCLVQHDGCPTIGHVFAEGADGRRQVARVVELQTTEPMIQLLGAIELSAAAGVVDLVRGWRQAGGAL